MTTPLPQPCKAGYFDGQTAKRHDITVAAVEGAEAIRLSFDAGWPDQDIPLGLLRRGGDQPGQAGQVMFHFLQPGDDEIQRDPARLMLPNGEFAKWLQSAAPNLGQRDVPRKTYSRLIKVGLFATASIAALLFVIIPGLAAILANTISREREVAIGKTVVGQIEYMLAGFSDTDLTCDTPAGTAALNRMMTRFTGTGKITYQIDARVIDHEMINAFAAPGGQVVILRGLLDAAESPDEVAGVLAHELGHVESRDPLREAIRSAGSAGILSLVLGDATGGTITAIMAEQMLSSAYTRTAEEKADSFGLDLLAAAKISPKGFEVFFDRIADMGGELPEVFSSHPATQSRKDKAAAAAIYDATAALSDADWQALKTICD